MDYEEAELLPPDQEGPGSEEAEIVRDFSEIPEGGGSSRRRLILRIALVILALLLVAIVYRGCTAVENTPDSELSSTTAEAAKNLRKAATSLTALAPRPGASAEEIAISLEDRAGVPVGVGSANEPGEVGVKIRGRRVVLESNTPSGKRFSIYRMN